MDLIILRAVALRITELERKSVPVLWATQAPEDLKRSQKIPETSLHTTGSQRSLAASESACHFRSVCFLKCNSTLFIYFPPWFLFPTSSPCLFVFLAVCSYLNSWKKTGGMTHLLFGNLCVLGRLWGKSFQSLTPWNCFKYLCWKYPTPLKYS